MLNRRQWLPALIAASFLLATWQVWSWAQQPVTPARAADPSRFEFEVIQSFDEKYAGDTPGHIGRAGGLEGRRPNVALGDPVFRDNQQIGTITSLAWSRAHGSLEVEFSPQPNVRVAVGDMVWLALDGRVRLGR